MSRKKHRKADNLIVTHKYLDERLRKLEASGYSKTRWIEFCEVMLGHGYTVSLYEARKTFSKYITVRGGTPGSRRSYTVRFSNHKPIKQRELNQDCDFFVGVNHTRTTTTAQAIAATLAFFRQPEPGPGAKP